MHKITMTALAFALVSGCASMPVKDSSVALQEKLCRRFPCEIQDDYRILELFYATDRRAVHKDDELYFTAHLDKQLTTGTFKASIRPGLKMSRMVPKKVRGRGDVGVEEVKELGEEDFLKRLASAVENSPHQSLLVLVFGYKDNFELTAIKAAYFAYFLDMNTPILVFDWPGSYLGAMRGYGKAWSSATASGEQLGKLLAKIIREVKPKKLWLESSSLGCQVVCNAFEWMCQQPDLADPEPELTNVVMAAPDVSQDEFDLKFKDEINSLSKQLTVYVASNDRALLMAQVLDQEKKLGRQSAQVESNDQFEEAKDLLYLKSLDPKRISIIDVTLVNRAGGGHTYYIETPEFYDDFYLRLFDEAVPHNRHLYLVNVKEGVAYWVIRGDENNCSNDYSP
jgi:esterase/lipase superfamily enzyme